MPTGCAIVLALVAVAFAVVIWLSGQRVRSRGGNDDWGG